MRDLRQYSHIAYDTETTGLQYPVDRVFGFSLAAPDGWSCYVDIREQPKQIQWLNDQMARYKGTVICHNASFDYRMSHISGIHLPLAQMDCTAVRACLIDEHLYSYELEAVCDVYLWEQGPQGRKISAIYEEMACQFGGLATRNVQMKNIHRAPSKIVSPYAIRDAELALKLWEWQEGEIEEESEIDPLRQIIDFERGLMPTIIRAEMRGIRADLDEADRAANALTPIIKESQTKLDRMAGWMFNVNSGPQVKKLLAPHKQEDEWYVGTHKVGKTKKGGPSLSAPYLREISHPAASLILETRSLIKTRDTFLRGHVIGHAHNGIVYPNINQNKGEEGGTGTGRLSYTNPAMQQIPNRNKKVAAIIKPCFLPPEGMVWVDGDMDQFEVRVFFHLVNDPDINSAYVADPHQDSHAVVAGITGLPRDASYSGQANAKQLNLSMIFNQGKGATAATMGMDWKWDSFINERGHTIRYKRAGFEAQRIIERYHMAIPGVKRLADGCKDVASDRGWVHTRRGRRLRFPGKKDVYKASGILIQAMSADFNKENWQIIEEELDGVGHLMLNTHDSYGLALPENDWYHNASRVKAAIERPGRARIPLTCTMSRAGKNWWDAIAPYEKESASGML